MWKVLICDLNSQNRGERDLTLGEKRSRNKKAINMLIGSAIKVIYIVTVITGKTLLRKMGVVMEMRR